MVNSKREELYNYAFNAVIDLLTIKRTINIDLQTIITDPKKQYDTAIRLIEKGDSVRQAEKNVRLKKKSPGIDEKYSVLYRDIEDTFQGFFGTKVKLDAGRRKGKIVIEYNSNDDLERILGLIK